MKYTELRIEVKRNVSETVQAILLENDSVGAFVLVDGTKNFGTLLFANGNSVDEASFAAIGDVVVGDVPCVNVKRFERVGGCRRCGVAKSGGIGGGMLGDGRFDIGYDMIAVFEEVQDFGIEEFGVGDRIFEMSGKSDISGESKCDRHGFIVACYDKRQNNTI